VGTVRRVLELDEKTDALIEALVARKGKDAASVVADAVELLDSVIDVYDPDNLEEDLRQRFEEFERTGIGVPGDEVIAWLESWGTPNELPPPQPRKLK